MEEEEEEDDEDDQLPTSDLGGVPWKEAVRIHALLKGRSEEELEASKNYEPEEEEEDEEEEEEEYDEEEEEESSEGQERSPLVLTPSHLPPLRLCFWCECKRCHGCRPQDLEFSGPHSFQALDGMQCLAN